MRRPQELWGAAAESLYLRYANGSVLIYVSNSKPSPHSQAPRAVGRGTADAAGPGWAGTNAHFRKTYKEHKIPFTCAGPASCGTRPLTPRRGWRRPAGYSPSSRPTCCGRCR